MELLVSLSSFLLSIYVLILARGVPQKVKKLDGESLYRSSQMLEVRQKLRHQIVLLGEFVSLAF